MRCWPLVVGGQGCPSTPSQAQGGPWTEVTPPQMSVLPRMRNPDGACSPQGQARWLSGEKHFGTFAGKEPGKPWGFRSDGRKRHKTQRLRRRLEDGEHAAHCPPPGDLQGGHAAFLGDGPHQPSHLPHPCVSERQAGGRWPVPGAALRAPPGSPPGPDLSGCCWPDLALRPDSLPPAPADPPVPEGHQLTLCENRVPPLEALVLQVWNWVQGSGAGPL